MTVRTRFAPSPTGRLHLGNVRAAAFNWLLAKHHGGSFVLRIEDTDADRNVAGGEEAILEDLSWLGLDWDEGPDIGGEYGPYRQSTRDNHYLATIQGLLERDAAYACFCTTELLVAVAEEYDDGRTAQRYSGKCRNIEIDERFERASAGEAHCIRIAVPEDIQSINIKDEIFGSISVATNEIEDFIVQRTDGRFTYNFAVVVDDIGMEISHVIRGVGHLSNTPKQAILFDVLSAPRPVFVHLPTVLGADGKKLSKRLGATAVAELRAEGFPADAVLNYLSLLGWSHPEEKEVLTRSDLIGAIGLERVGKSDTQLDEEKLRWVSSRHLGMEELQEIADHVRPFVDTGMFPEALTNFQATVDALRTRLSTYGDINKHLEVLYPDEGDAEEKRQGIGSDPEVRKVLTAVQKRLIILPDWGPEALDQAVRAGGKDVEARGAALFHPVRKLLIGSEKGPDLGKILAALGRPEALRRFDQGCS